MKRILVLDDNQTICIMLKSWLLRQGYQVDTATKVNEAKEKVMNNPFDLILSDIKLPESDGFSFLNWVKKYDSDIVVIMMTGFADIESAVNALKLGAVDYIPKPIKEENLFRKIADALLNHERLKNTKEVKYSFVIPKSKKYEKLFAGIENLFKKEQHLLIAGRRGTGKTSLIKHLIYGQKSNFSRPFVVLAEETQSAAKNSIDAEKLCDAYKRATGGFLSFRITALTLDGQNQLLHLMKSQNSGNAFVQLLLISNFSKDELKNELLPKLYNTLEDNIVELPVLKGDDELILFFIDYFLAYSNSELDKNILSIEQDVISELLARDWPGNIQELKNVLLKAAVLTSGDKIGMDVLPQLFKECIVRKEFNGGFEKNTLDAFKKENYEKEKIIEALEITGGNKTMAASLLNIDRKTLYNKIKLYRMKK